MTREERLELLKQIEKDIYTCSLESTFEDEAKSCAIHSAIEELEQGPCEDCISRQAVEKITWEAPSYTDALNVLTEVRDKVRALPSVKPQEPKIGHWSRKTKVDAYDIAGVKTWGIKCQCDRCSFTTIVVEDFGYYKYCPNCGCRMESEE